MRNAIHFRRRFSGLRSRYLAAPPSTLSRRLQFAIPRGKDFPLTSLKFVLGRHEPQGAVQACRVVMRDELFHQAPGILQQLAVLSPATYVLRGVRAALLDGAALPALWSDIWPALVLGLVAIPVGLWAFGLAERYAKRAGKLARSG